MLTKYMLQARVTGVLIEEGRILIVRQTITGGRRWSLPGGRIESGEAVDSAIYREIYEETGLHTKIVRFLYLCDYNDAMPPILHLTFLLKRVGGCLTLPTNEFDENPIHDVKMVGVSDLPKYGFSQQFTRLVVECFPDAGDYRGHKRNIGL